jgi:hypothetical protein
VFVRDIGQQHLQVRQQGRDFLRIEDGGLDLELGASGRRQRRVGFDLPLELLEGRPAGMHGGLGRRGASMTTRTCQIRSGFPSHVRSSPAFRGRGSEAVWKNTTLTIGRPSSAIAGIFAHPCSPLESAVPGGRSVRVSRKVVRHVLPIDRWQHEPLAIGPAPVERAMDLTAAISGFQQSKVMAQVQMRVAKKVLDMQEMQGGAAIKLIQAASQTAGKSGDALVAAATGLGGGIDTYG